MQIIHICNLHTPEHTNFRNIYSNDELQETKKEGNLIYLINIHLNWEDHKLSSNFGFNIGNDIRIQLKSKSPIVFYSPLPASYFEKKSKKEIKYKILFGRGSEFIQIPIKEQELVQLAESIQPLSNAALHDVATMLCDLKGMVIDKLNHDLKFDADVSKVIDSISPYLSTYQKQLISIDEFAHKLQQRISSEDINGFFSDKQQFITLCNLQLTGADNIQSENKKTKHKILVIDDRTDELDYIISNLTDSFEIIHANKAEKAIEEIKNDTSNNITAIISDWRLYKDQKQDYWQDMQGYEILEFASKNGLRALFALTSQADFVVHHIRNLMGVRFTLFKKENLQTSAQWKVFIDVLNESCEQAVQLRASLPDDSAQWTKVIFKNGEPLKTLKEQYIKIWNSEKRDSYFSKITSSADDIWDYLKTIPNNNPLSSEFGITVPTKILELEPILIYRRIWLALWFNKTDIGKRISKETSSEYSQDIYKRMFAPGIKKDMPNSGTQNAYKLCIEINKIQQGKFLPEEKEWLMYQNLLA